MLTSLEELELDKRVAMVRVGAVDVTLYDTLNFRSTGTETTFGLV